MNSFKISKSVMSSFDVVLILDALGEKDLNNGRRREEDIRDLINMKMMDSDFIDRSENFVFHLKCNSKQEMADILILITKMCSSFGFKPLVFIDGHGDYEKGLSFTNGEFYSWLDLKDSFEAINQATNGYLTVFAAFCYSYNLIKYFIKDKLIPVSFYYGYEDIVTAGEIADESKIIYQSFIDDGGKGLQLDSLKVKIYTEYDHVQEHLFLMYLFCNKDKSNNLLRKFPNLSRNKIRSEVRKFIAEKGFPLKGFNFIYAGVINNLLENYLKIYIWPSERLDIWLSELKGQSFS